YQLSYLGEVLGPPERWRGGRVLSSGCGRFATSGSSREFPRGPAFGYSGGPMAHDAVHSGQTPFVSEGYFHQLLQKAVAAGASDVHLKVGQPPGARVAGSLVFFR